MRRTGGGNGAMRFALAFAGRAYCALRYAVAPYPIRAILIAMPNYRRAFVPGGCWFFTVNVIDRRRRLLTDHIDALRAATRLTQTRHPFTIDAMVVLPDHIHAVWTLPPDDADFSLRWRLIKIAFAQAVPKTEPRSAVRIARRTRHLAAPVLGAPDPRR